uniref:Uncharacterized protein n=1 Tax=Rhizophora mucronata TaxID=61149 RepID=A0A2P2P728_RHIMU
MKYSLNKLGKRINMGRIHWFHARLLLILGGIFLSVC